MKIVIIGAGNLAWHIAPPLLKMGHQIIGVYSRTSASANALAKKVRSKAFVNVDLIPDNADLYLIALQDKAIASVVKQLKFVPQLIAHTSGAVPLSVFPSKFKNNGVFYPLQSFSKNRKVKLDSVPFLLESSNSKTKKILSDLAKQYSDSVHFVTSDKRKKIHLAAVFANNFVNHLYSISADILKENNLSFDILKPLIAETAAKVRENHPDKMQTGPARRNDQPIIEQHLRLLKGQKQRKAIYTLLNQSILDKFKGKN
jgi:predicted short-subunit dehydrogenase-like oxidoreductase (DUF2520 family)